VATICVVTERGEEETVLLLLLLPQPTARPHANNPAHTIHIDLRFFTANLPGKRHLK